MAPVSKFTPKPQTTTTPSSRFTPKPKTTAQATSTFTPKPKAAPYADKPTTLTNPPRFTGKQPPLANLVSWSYSVYSQYLKCPLSVCFDKVKRIRMIEPPNPHFEKGDRVHKAAEMYIGSEGKAPPIIPDLKAVKDKLIFFRKARAKVELEWAFTKQYLPTSWFGSDAWLRVKTDVCHDTAKPPLVHITDWKTGRVYDDHKQQRSLYALAGLQLVELGQLAGGSKDVHLTAEHLYTDTTQSATEEYTMKDLKPLKNEWASRIKQMMSDTKYPAKPGFHCRYCKYRKSNQGPCSEG